MSEVIKNLNKALQRVNLVYGILTPILIAILAGRFLTFVNPNFFKNNYPVYVISFITLILGLIVLIVHFKSVGKLSRLSLAAAYILYHIGFAALVIFEDPYLTPFYFQIIATLIAVDLGFGRKWQMVSILCFTLVIYLSYINNSPDTTTEGLILVGVYSIGAASVGILVSKYRRISDEERSLLDKTSRQSVYERQRLMSLINNMGEAVIATDEHGKVLLYNAATLALLDTNQSLDNISIDKVLSLKDKRSRPVKLTKLMSTSPTGLTENDLIHEFGPGDFINMYINIAPIKLGFKEDVKSGYIIIVRDITKEKSLEDERDEFISVVSHELRTPAAIAEGGVSNAIFAIENKVAKKEILGALNESHEQILFLSSMINDLATLSRAERTDKKLEISTIKPGALLEDIAKDYQDQALEKKLTLSISAANDTRPIKSSELYLREILQNFITNSLKYTKKGSIIVHVRSNSEGQAVFSVADSGIGLSKSDKRHIFDKFFRSEDYRTRESSGTGLGLYVTLKLANRLNAKIDVESELNKGSTFTITVPSYKK